MNILQIVVLACVQGLAELLPVSSSAHVIVAEKLMGLDPTAPEMTMLLVMLHTGTMFAVIAYFWRSWKATYFASCAALLANGRQVAVATAMTGVVGLTLLAAIRHLAGTGATFEVEQLFGNSRLMAASLGVAGLLITGSAWRASDAAGGIGTRSALWIGAVQGLCLPFRGLSRSGATISTAMLAGVERRPAEEFSFALAVVLTPAVIAAEGHRLLRAQAAGSSLGLAHVLWPSLLGMVLSFGAGLVALRWLSRWLEHGRWHYFGIYCLVAAAGVLVFA